jgi:hypothetical protein
MKIFFNGIAGRLEGHYDAPSQNTPVGKALILHPHPLYGGTMNNKIVHAAYQAFKSANYAVMRFNFRGVGRSEGEHGKGSDDLSDAAAALNWMSIHNPSISGPHIIVGYSFGAWIGMQLLMRRPDISQFIIIAPPITMFDFNFLAPCPNPGLVIYGGKDQLTPSKNMEDFIRHLKGPKNNNITTCCLDNADHYFKNHTDDIKTEIWHNIQNISSVAS